MVEYDKGGGRRLLVGYTDDRAKKDAYTERREYAGWKRLTSMVRLMPNDLNGHEQWRTYGAHLYVTYGAHLYVTYGVHLYVTHGVHSHVTYWGTLICHSLKDKGLGYLFY